MIKRDFCKYELRDQLGRGGMAWVYLAWDKTLTREVAIKVLFPQLAEDEMLAARFEREARSAAQMQHENIVRIHGAGRCEGVPYIDMECIRGVDLKRWLEMHKPLPVEIGLLILRDICRALEHAHEPGRDIVHRDLKPSNVMFARDGSVKLMDFGLARRTEDELTMTSTGVVLGTVPYMSPEQSAGQRIENVGDLKLSDIFSTGIVAYELLGGERPFQGETASAITHSIQNVEPPSLSDLNPLVPEEVVQIIHRMLQKLMTKRCPSISLVVEELDGAIERMQIPREKATMREYAQDPGRMGEELRRRSLSRHLNQGLHFERMGFGKIDDAEREFRRVLHLDPKHPEAKEHLKGLERERDAARRGEEQRDLDATLPLPRPPDLDQTVPAPPPRPRPLPMRTLAIAAGALALAIATILIVIGLRPHAATLTVSARPEDSQVRLDDREPVPAASASFARVPAGMHRLEVTRDGYTPYSASVGITARRDTVVSVVLERSVVRLPPDSTSHPTPPPVETATVTVRTDPAGARIKLGSFQWRASPAIFEQVAAGPRNLRAELAGYTSMQTTLTVFAGRDTTIELALQQAVAPPPIVSEVHFGTLSIVTTPPAKYYYVDDTLRSLGAASFQMKARAGAHRVRVEHPDYDTKRWDNVAVSPDQTQALTWDFEKASGHLKITSSTDDWAWIFVDGTDLHVHTARTLPIRSGQHRVRLEREGFTIPEGEVTVDVRPGEVTDVRFTVRRGR